MALTDNIVAYWKLDESSGNASDSVGSNTLTNNNSTAFGTGKINNGADFEASSSNYFTGSVAASLTTNFTVAFWLKLETNTSNRIYQSGTGAGHWDISTDASGFLRFTEDSIADYTSSSSMSTGTWYHCAVVKSGDSGTNITFYINGVAAGTASVGSVTTPSGTAYFGGYNGASNFLDGVLDEFGLWSRALTAGEISQLYNGGNGSQYTFTDVGIALDTVHGTSTSSSANSRSLTSLQCSGNNRIIIAAVSAGLHNAGVTVSSITYGGVAMTQLGSYFKYTGDGFRWSLWYLVAPTTSSGQTLSLTISATTYVSVSAVSYTGVDQSNPFTTLQTTDDSATPGSVQCTSDRNGSWMIGLMASANAGLSISSGGIKRQDAWATYSFMADSNTTIANAGTNTFSFAWSSGGACGGAAMMRPVLASAIKTVDGLALASVKTVDGLAIASVKNINGLA